MSKPESVKKNLRAGLVSRLRTLTGQGGIPRLKPTKRGRPWPGASAKRLAFLGLMLIPVLPSIAADYRDYPDDVRLLLEEYAGASDQGGSLIPSVYAFRSSQTERVLIDFDRGLIVVSAPSISLLLKDIHDVLLTQIDPGVIDAGTANDLGLQGKSGKPFLYGQVHDHNGQPIDTQQKAEEFAFHLFDTALSQRGDFTVRIPMIRQHKSVAGNKYEQWVRAASSKHRIRSSLIMAIMETESSFNPMARSRSNALGLMQIKANTAGRDYFSLIAGYKHTPTSAYLYNPQNNIEVGTGYLAILADRYLRGIYHPLKLEYAMISSYNGGAGNLWKSLDPAGNKQRAVDRVNKMTPEEFYWFLTNRHNREETRNYVKKVTSRMPKYANI